MALELTAEQQRKLAESSEFPHRVANPSTGEMFVLIHAELFERVRPLLEDEDEIAAVRETYPLINAVLDINEAGAADKESA